MTKENRTSTIEVLGRIIELIEEIDTIWKERIDFEVEIREKKEKLKKLRYKDYLQLKEKIINIERLKDEGGIDSGCNQEKLALDEILYNYGENVDSFYERIRGRKGTIYDLIIWLTAQKRFLN